MIHALIFISVLFLGIIIYLMNKIQEDRLKFLTKMKMLQDFMLQLDNERQIQNNQILLTKDIQQKLKVINTTLSKDIYELSYTLFEESNRRK